MTSSELRLLRKIEDAERAVRTARIHLKLSAGIIAAAGVLEVVSSLLTNGQDGWVAGQIVAALGIFAGLFFFGYLVFAYFDADLEHDVTKARRDYEDYLTEQAEGGR
ncbi:hypothetical protein ACWEF6_01820 [Amycolatopsis sp. NPDC004772]